MTCGNAILRVELAFIYTPPTRNTDNLGTTDRDTENTEEDKRREKTKTKF